MSRYLLVLLTAAILTATVTTAEPLFETKNIFPIIDKHSHGSSIIECPNGDLLACWFHGSGERTADDVLIQGARLKKGAKAWGPVFLMADTPGFPDCNPVLYLDGKQRLWLFWLAVQANRWECGLLKYRRAENYQGDGAPDWSWQDVINLKPGEAFAKALEEGFDAIDYNEGMWGEYALPYHVLMNEAARDPYKRQTGWMPRIHPITLPSGRILLPLYSDGFNVSLVAISDDMGDTWRASLPIVGMGPTQPTLVRKKDGSIIAYLRDTGEGLNRVQASTSKDDGETWTPSVDTDIPNPDSSLQVLPLKDGAWLMIHNDTDDGRHRLAASLSEDEGATWAWKRYLEPSEKEGRSFSYPSVIQTRDGLVHMTYSYVAAGGERIRHCTINTEWVKAGK